MEPNQECYNSQDPNDPFFSDKIIINEETEILMEESEDELIETVEPLKLLYGICMKCGQRRSYYRKASRSTVYSAIWKDGPRILWNHQNQEYKRSKTQVLVKLYHEDQVNEILNELKIYLDCYAQDYAFLDWEIKLHLLLYLAEDLKALHNSGYVHRNLNPPNVLVFENGLCAIGSYSKCRKDLSSPNAEEIFGWQRYMAPEFLRYKPYTKASDIYSFGMIMYTVGTGMIPYNKSHDDQYLTLDVCIGLRPKIPVNIPESFSELVIRCWNDEPESRPNIHEIHNTLMNWWSSIYNKCPNSTCLEFLAANDRDHINLKSQKIIQQKPENDKPLILPDLKNLEPLELIKFIISNHFVKYINRDELSTTMEHIGISFDETTEEYLFVMQYADGGIYVIIFNKIFQD
ncbi:unnamed protein product [Rhizophagus irregularis]|nr:unnamed protein product [Rhizophagus irregularis]